MKMQVAFQAKAAGFFRPQAQQRCVKNRKSTRTPAWNARCVFPMLDDFFFFF
jgi:hypothetical protein